MILNREDITVYIVDDEYPVRDALSMLIKSEGLDVKSYDSALDFLQHYEPGQPGCLVLDVRMPQMDGLELQQELTRRNIDIPIIFMSGHGDIPITAKVFRAGAIDFIEKPFDNKLLLDRINETIDNILAIWQEHSEKYRIQHCYTRLTDREKEVMKLIVTSHSNKQAAKVLEISNRTVDVHRAHLMEKMHAYSLSDLIVKAIACEIL
jgi:FixJ family two-component response regulator